MKITPIPHGLDLLASDLVRSPGLHISTIYNSLFKQLEPKRYGGGDGPNPLMTAMGTAWEQHLEFLLAKAGVTVFRPGELVTSNGIAYSPDGIIDDNRLAEFKVAWWMSSKDMPRRPASSFPPKFDKYVCQMQSYALNLELSLARLYVLFIQGAGRDPELLVYDIEFTERELQTNWSMMMNHAKQRKML